MTEHVPNKPNILLNKIWQKIEHRFNLKQVIILIGLHKLNIRIDNSSPLKYNKLLVITALIIELLTFLLIINLSGISIYPFKIDFRLAKTLLLEHNYLLCQLILAIIGYYGALLLIMRTCIGLWISTVWAASQVILLIYGNNIMNTNCNIFNAFNIQPALFHFAYVWCNSSSTILDVMNYISLGKKIFIEFGPNLITIGWGINIVGIFFVIILSFIHWQNDLLATWKSRFKFILTVIIVACLPFGIYYILNNQLKDNINNFLHEVHKADFENINGMLSRQDEDKIIENIIKMDSNNIINKIISIDNNNPEKQTVWAPLPKKKCKTYIKAKWNSSILDHQELINVYIDE